MAPALNTRRRRLVLAALASAGLAACDRISGLGAMFTGYAWRLWRDYSDALARRTFRFSIVHLALLFAALLVDHYLWPLI